MSGFITDVYGGSRPGTGDYLNIRHSKEYPTDGPAWDEYYIITPHDMIRLNASDFKAMIAQINDYLNNDQGASE